jgi:tRNA pseudouridine38-40 synthase
MFPGQMGGSFSAPELSALPLQPPAELPLPESKVPMNKGKTPGAILYSYIGTGLHSLQLSKNVPTIEDRLFHVLIGSNLIPDRSPHTLNKTKWSEASRTDSGVHVTQIVSYWATLPC